MVHLSHWRLYRMFTRFCHLRWNYRSEPELWLVMVSDGTLSRRLSSTGLRLIRTLTSGNEIAFLLLIWATAVSEACLHLSGLPCLAIVADYFGRNFVTRTTPCVRFIVYRPHKLTEYLSLIEDNTFTTFDSLILKVNPGHCMPPGAGRWYCAALLQHWEHEGVQGGGGAEPGGGCICVRNMLWNMQYCVRNML